MVLACTDLVNRDIVASVSNLKHTDFPSCHNPYLISHQHDQRAHHIVMKDPSSPAGSVPRQTLLTADCGKGIFRFLWGDLQTHHSRIPSPASLLPAWVEALNNLSDLLPLQSLSSAPLHSARSVRNLEGILLES